MSTSTENTHNMRRLRPADRVARFGVKDVWSMFAMLAHASGATDLGAGYMNYPPLEFVKQAAKEAVASAAFDQYTLPRGHPRLCHELALRYASVLKREKLDPTKEVMVTAGAYEGLYATMLAYINPGDEVIVMEPFFNQYVPIVTLNGGTPVIMSLKRDPNIASVEGVTPASAWCLDIDELKSKVTPKTKMIILNTPHNPLGKVFSHDELVAIGNVAEEHDLLIVSDEVYETLVYSPAVHVPIASIDRFWQRTITVGSAGKAFGVTGWRVGSLIAPESLLGPVLAARANTVFCANHPLQEAAASSFAQARENGFFTQQREDLAEKRNVLASALKAVGLPFTMPDGGFFIVADLSQVRVPETAPIPDYVRALGQGYMIAYWLCTVIGVASIPVSEFYANKHDASSAALIRFAFCKKKEVLEEGATRLLRLKEFMVTNAL